MNCSVEGMIYRDDKYGINCEMLTLLFIYYHFHYFDFIFLLEVAYHLSLDIKSDLFIENCTSDLIIYYGHNFSPNIGYGVCSVQTILLLNYQAHSSAFTFVIIKINITY